MRTIIELLLVAGIFVNLIKGGELLLRPHQQKWLQDKLVTLTLKLDYTKPLDYSVPQMLDQKTASIRWKPVGSDSPFLSFQNRLLLAFGTPTLDAVVLHYKTANSSPSR